MRCATSGRLLSASQGSLETGMKWKKIENSAAVLRRPCRLLDVIYIPVSLRLFAGLYRKISAYSCVDRIVAVVA